MSEVNGLNSITSNTSLVLATGQDDYEDASDARMLSGNKNIHSTLVMRRQRSNASAKEILGVRPRTHYRTILTQPNNKSKAYQIRETNSYFMRGTQELAGHILRYAPNKKVW